MAHLPAWCDPGLYDIIACYSQASQAEAVP